MLENAVHCEAGRGERKDQGPGKRDAGLACAGTE